MTISRAKPGAALSPSDEEDGGEDESVSLY